MKSITYDQVKTKIEVRSQTVISPLGGGRS